MLMQLVRDNGLLLIFVFLRSPATRVASAQELDALLADGTPKVVEFYSDL